MKKIAFALLCALALTACEDKKTNAPDVAAIQRDSLQRIIDSKDNEINDMMATLNEIQEGFRIINAAEGKVAVIKDGEATNKKEQLRESMRTISQAMEHNRQLIAKLQKQVNASTVQGEQLKATIEGLMAQLQDKDTQLQKLADELARKDIHIAELDKTVSSLNSDVSALKDESESKSQTISAQDKQINTAWYVFGTKKELQAQNIYNGGKVLQSNFNKNYFTKIDIRNEKVIKLYSKSAKLLTNHPEGSYTLVPDASKQYVLTITNPSSFWGASKYLVVLVK